MNNFSEKMFRVLVALVLFVLTEGGARPIGPYDGEIDQHLHRISKLIIVMFNTTDCLDGDQDKDPKDAPKSSSSSNNTSSSTDTSSFSSSNDTSYISDDTSTSSFSNDTSSISDFRSSSNDSSSSIPDDTSSTSDDTSSSIPADTSSSNDTSSSSDDTSSSIPDDTSSSNDTSSSSDDSSSSIPDDTSSSNDTSSSSSDDSSSSTLDDRSSSTPPETQCEYSDFSPSHTLLLPEKPECNIHQSGISEEEKKEILELHNQLRVKVARGEEKRGTPGPQPAAADMKELIWNEELAQVAQAWASQCPHGHDSYAARHLCSRDYPVGQNIHYYWGHDLEPDWRRAVSRWYDEVVHFSKEVVDSFEKNPKKEISHYTQVVWASTKEVGCGIIYYVGERQGNFYYNSKTYVCNYGTAGNVRDRPLYKRGAAASACEEGVSPNYPELCL